MEVAAELPLGRERREHGALSYALYRAGRHRSEDLCTVVISGVRIVFLRAQRVTVGSRVYLGWTWVDEPCKKVLVG